MKTKLFGHCISVLVLIAVLLSGCSAPKDKVTMQFAWLHTAEYAGFYLAAEKGYYADENIDINLVAGGYGIDSIAEVTENRAQFGISRGTNMIVARSKGQDIVAVGTIFRKSPWFVGSLKEAGITTPQDLEGKTIGIETGDPNFIENVQFIAMLKNLNVDTSSIKFVARDFADAIANDLQPGKTDADAAMFGTEDPVKAQMRGIELNAIYYSDYDMNSYGNLIFANADFLKKNPDLAARFMRATLRGYQYALEHHDEAAAATLKYDPKLDAKTQTAMMKAEVPMIDTGDQPIGWMDEDIWQSTADILLAGGFIPSAVDVKSLFTNEFIPK
jgi:ABC-type nitrate/sulfonate/bicarbonate transport system substrate-binding protein